MSFLPLGMATASEKAVHHAAELSVAPTVVLLSSMMVVSPLELFFELAMESKKVKNLYFAGEILDVDGDCGGYNLTFAWISGILAGVNSSKEYLND